MPTVPVKGGLAQPKQNNMTLKEIYQRLKEGNQIFLLSKQNQGDVSPEIRKETALHGQHPFATVICCSDSRVIPEDIFNVGIGELFVIRVAGNVASPSVLGSIEYAIHHLHTPLVLVLGHTHCGAVDAAIHHQKEGYVGELTKPIMEEIGNEQDEREASILNAIGQVDVIQEKLDCDGVDVVAALYDIETGEVQFLDENNPF